MTAPRTSSKHLTIAIRLGIVLTLCCVFVGVALAASLTDSTIDNFSQGTGDCFVSQADTGQVNGAVILSPTRAQNFSGPILPGDWYSDTGGSFLGGGNLYVIGKAGTWHPPFFAPSRTLEFAASFVTNTQFQDGGFSQFIESSPYAIFSTGAQPEVTGLRARSNNAVEPEINTNLGFGYFDAPHLYRIEWQLDRVNYFIDGVQVATHTIQFTDTLNAHDTMRPTFESVAGAGISLTLNWARMSDYAPSPCTFTSRAIDAGVSTSWTNFTTTLDQPPGTSSSFEVRGSPDGIDWSSGWQAVTSNIINLNGRYVQYRATLTTTDPLMTPQLLNVTIENNATAVELQSFSAGAATSDTTRWLIAGLALGSLLFGLSTIYLIKRRKQI